ncbi:MAG: tRNA lysidine(34) synthetase TilS, partial [Pseudomonadota bacterium]
MAAVSPPRALIIAVSGGADSMALAVCARDVMRLGAATFLAVTVDHGLRREAAEEARQAAAWCRELGLRHRTMVWRGEKPGAGLQEAAREARYRLLCEAAYAEGAGAIVTGHSADDQAETVFMRLARGSGTRGLAAMAKRSVIAAGAGREIALLRPFLGVSRRRLRATVEAAGRACIDDPSNDDPAYERIRTRALLAALRQQDLLSRDALTAAADKARASAALAAREEAAAFDRAGCVFRRWGAASAGVRLSRNESASLFARQVLFAVGGGETPPADAAIEMFLQRLRDEGAATLAGAVARRKGETVWIWREAAALLGRAGVPPIASETVSPGAAVLWDRRFIIENASEEAIEVAPAGAATDAVLRVSASRIAGSGAPSDA